MYPTFKITKVTESSTGLEVEGNLSSDSYKNDKWIDNDWLGFLKDENLMIYGRWKENNGEWKFLNKFSARQSREVLNRKNLFSLFP